jgi:hypothetical protein
MNCLLGLIILVSSAFAQPPDTLWTRTYGGNGDDAATDVVLTDDGGFAISAIGQYSILKADSLGNVQWTRHYSGVFTDIVRTPDGGYVLAGGIGNNLGFMNAYLLRLDSQGDSLWGREYTDSTLWYGAQAVAMTPVQGFVMVGTVTNEYMWANVIVIATDSLGDTLWTRRSAGMFDDEGGYDVQVDANGIIYIAGYSNPYPSGHYMYGMRFSPDGELLGEILYTWSESWSSANAVAVRPDGSYLLAGKQYTPWDPQTTLYVIDVSADDQFVRSSHAGSTADEQAYDIKLTSNGGFITAGYSDSFISFERPGTMYVVQFDSAGELEWQTTVGRISGELASAVAIYPGGEILAVGVLDPGGYSDTDIYVAKLAAPLNTENNAFRVPVSFSLSAYPNPFNNATTIHYELQKAGDVKISIYNVLGEEVAVLKEGRESAGEHTVNWTPETGSGLYFAAIRAGDMSRIMKLVYIR